MAALSMCKRDLFQRWKDFDVRLGDSKVMKDALNKYYFTSSHSPAPVIQGEEFHRAAFRFSSILNEILPLIVEGYFKEDRQIRQTLSMEEAVQSLLAQTNQNGTSFPLGSYRPDFLLQPKETKNPFLVCEINARFALNGYLFSYYLYKAQMSQEYGDGIQLLPVRNLIPTLLSSFDLSKSIGVLKKREVGYGVHILANYMKEYHPLVSFRIVDPAELYIKDGKLRDNIGFISQFIVELHQDEILDIAEEIITELVVNCRCVNDFRTIFLLHDKRLLSLLSNQTFLEKYLSKEDAKFVAECVVPTWVVALHPDKVAEAIENQADFIIKPNLLGKGEGTLIGADCEPCIWKEYLTDKKHENYVLQNFFPSQIISHESVRFSKEECSERGEIAMNLRNIVGMLLSHNNDFFGVGFFRISQDKICALSRGGNSCLPARSSSYESLCIPLSWEKDIISEANIRTNWKNQYLSSFRHDSDIIPLDIGEHNQNINIFAELLQQEGILAESNIILSLFHQGNMCSDSLCFTQLAELCERTVLPMGSNVCEGILALFDQFPIETVAGELTGLLQLSDLLGERTAQIRNIIVGYSPLQLCQRKQLSVRFSNASIHSILGSSLLGIWAFQKQGTTHYRTCKEIIQIHGIGEDFDSSRKLIVSTNRKTTPLKRCLLKHYECDHFTVNEDSSYSFQIKD